SDVSQGQVYFLLLTAVYVRLDTRSLPAKSEELPPEPTSTQGDSLNESKSSKQAMGMVGSEEEILHMDFKTGRDKITERITEEWEKLIVNEIPKISSPTCVSKPKLDHLAFRPLESNTRGAFIQPAFYDAFGLTVVEALTCGLPTFATLRGGPAKIIVHGKSSLHIDPYHETRKVVDTCWSLWIPKACAKLDRLEIRHYLEMFYALKYRKLAESVPLAVDDEK
nr:sucrose synthase [Tanacetum cinerariifolium]